MLKTPLPKPDYLESGVQVSCLTADLLKFCIFKISGDQRDLSYLFLKASQLGMALVAAPGNT